MFLLAKYLSRTFLRENLTRALPAPSVLSQSFAAKTLLFSSQRSCVSRILIRICCRILNRGFLYNRNPLMYVDGCPHFVRSLQSVLVKNSSPAQSSITQHNSRISLVRAERASKFYSVPNSTAITTYPSIAKKRKNSFLPTSKHISVRKNEKAVFSPRRNTTPEQDHVRHSSLRRSTSPFLQRQRRSTSPYVEAR